MTNFHETNAYKCFEFGTHCKKITTALNRMCKLYPEISADIKELEESYENYGCNFNECDDTTAYGDKQAPTYRFIVDFNGEDYWYICMYYFKNTQEPEQAEAEQTVEKQSEFKFYTNVEKLSDNYFSLEYYKVRNNKIVGHGFEDFTRERIKTAVKFYNVKLLTGDSVTTTTGVTRRKKETLSHVVAVPASVKKSDVLTFVVLEYGENVEISKTYTRFFFYENFDSTIKKIIAHTVEPVQAEAEQTSEQEESAEQTEAEQTVQKTLAGMKNNINKKFGVNCVYNDTDSIMCDNTIQTVSTHKDNNDIYDCFSDVKLTGTTAQIKYATVILNAFYKQLCKDIEFEYKMRVYDDIDVEDKDFYTNLSTYVTILKKVLSGNNSRDVIRNKDKFEVWGNIYRTAMNFIIAYNDDKPDWVIKHLESKLRKELFKDIQIIF